MTPANKVWGVTEVKGQSGLERTATSSLRALATRSCLSSKLRTGCNLEFWLMSCKKFSTKISTFRSTELFHSVLQIIIGINRWLSPSYQYPKLRYIKGHALVLSKTKDLEIYLFLSSITIWEADLFFYCARYIKTNMIWGECRMILDECSLVTIWDWLSLRKDHQSKSQRPMVTDNN